MRVGIVGLGAIGGTVAARLSATRPAGEDLQLAAGSEAAAAAIRAHGLSVTGGGPRLAIAADARASLPGGADYDRILLCVRGEATAATLDAALPLLAPSGAVVCLQNGLPETAVAARAGAARTQGAVIGWSATAEGPGRFRVTGRGGFLLGAADPRGPGAAASLRATRDLLARAFPTRITGDLAGARWGKLALNCAISTLGAVSGLSFGELAARRDGRALALRCIAEVVAVAHRKGVRPAPVSGLRAWWLANRGGGGMQSPLRPLRHALFWLASRQRPGQRSGMLERLLAGRTSGQIDDLNGAVVAEARAAGLEAPLNRALVELVHALERGEEKLGVGQLERLAREFA